MRLERTYVHRKEGFELLAVDMPARLAMPLNQWLPCRYLDSYTWPVPPPDKRVRKEEGTTYYNASRPVDEPLIATVSREEDGSPRHGTPRLEMFGQIQSSPASTRTQKRCCQAGGTATLDVRTFVFKGTLEQLLEKVKQER